MEQKYSTEQVYADAEKYYQEKGLPALGSFDTLINGCFAINFFAAIAKKKPAQLSETLQRAAAEMRFCMKQEQRDTQYNIFQTAIANATNKTQLSCLPARINKTVLLSEEMKADLLKQVEEKTHTIKRKSPDIKIRIAAVLKQYEEQDYTMSIYALKRQVKISNMLTQQEKEHFLAILEEVQETIPKEMRNGITLKHYQKKDVVDKKQMQKKKEEKTKQLFAKKVQFCLEYAEEHRVLPPANVNFPEELGGKSAYSFWRTLRYEKYTPKKYMQWREAAVQLLSPYYQYCCEN